MNIYLLENTLEHHYGIYISVMVIAESEAEARKIHPSFSFTRIYCYHKGYYKDWKDYWREDNYSDWCDPKDVKITKVGIAEPWMIQQKVLISNYLDG